MTTLSESEAQFMLSILGEVSNSESPMKEACAWYVGFLECKIREAWNTLFRDLLIAIDPLTNEPYPFTDRPCSGEISAAFVVLTTIVRECSERESLALTDLVDKLYNENQLKETDEEERALANQLAFAAFSWICMLNAVPTSKPNQDLIIVFQFSRTVPSEVEPECESTTNHQSLGR